MLMIIIVLMITIKITIKITITIMITITITIKFCSPEVPSYEILGAQHLHVSLYEKSTSRKPSQLRKRKG